MVLWLGDRSSSFPFLSLITCLLTICSFSQLPYLLVWRLFQAAYGRNPIFLSFPPFRLDTSTNPSTVLKFAVSLSRFRSFSLSSLLWSSDVTLLGFLALKQIYLLL